ncbi:glycosyltransferase [Methylobacterium sp. DB1607]|nr:glycosyltransferase [Methylobacterium sp. DB1607]
MIHKISYWFYIDLRSGGPSGYLANLGVGLVSTQGEPKIGPTIWLDSEPRLEGQSTVMDTSADALRNHTNWFGNIDAIALPDHQVDRALSGGVRSLHCHTVTDCLMTIQSLAMRNVRVPVLFSSHSPEAYSKEFADLWGDRGHDNEKVCELRDAVQAVELRAFERSDVWIFPCIEAMDGYEETLPGFSALRRNKDIRYVRSGVVRPESAGTRQEARSRLGLDQSKVLLYIGRHNTTKGYDVFSEAARRLLDRHNDLKVVVAGRPGPLPTLSNPRCIELGWHPNPGLLLQAADVFVLPNKTTYYDLILLEALSLGVPVVASATGGNREAAAIADGSIALFERGNIDEFVAVVEAVLNEGVQREAMSRGGLNAYQQYYTPEIFANKYRALIHQIWLDYGLYG